MTGTGRRMDAIALLKRDHRRVETLFDKFERTSKKGAKGRKKLVRKIVDELSLHADIEEQLCYPAVQEVTKEDGPVFVAIEEHEVVKSLLRQLETMEPEEERFDAKMTVLRETLTTTWRGRRGTSSPRWPGP